MADFYQQHYDKNSDQNAFLQQHGPGATIAPGRSNEPIPLSTMQYNQSGHIGMPMNQQPTIGFVNPGLPPPNPHFPPNAGFVQPKPPFAPNPGFMPHVPPQPQQPSYSGGYIDPEDPLRPEVKGFEFSDESIRRGFIRKVYSILSVQLAVTLGFIFLVGYENNTREWVATHPAMLYTSIGILFFSLIVMACVETVRRKAPLNFIFLGMFTLAESYMVAMCTFRFSKDDVLLAIGLTTVVCVALTIFAFQTKWDFTMLGGILFVAVIILMLIGILAIFVRGKTMILIYSSIGALIFSVYLIYDTQMMMGGTHKYSVSPEEYIFAALTLYLDIINIFIYILQIIGAAKD